MCACNVVDTCMHMYVYDVCVCMHMCTYHKFMCLTCDLQFYYGKCKKSISGAAITNGQAHFKTLKISTLHVNTSVVISMETLLEERNNIVGAGKNHFVHGPRRVPLGVRGTVLQKPAIG